MKKKLAILLLTLLATSCAQTREQYWRDRLARHEADYAKQPGAIPRVVAFYNNSIVLDTVSLDTQMVMMIERTDSFALLRTRQQQEVEEARHRDSITETEAWTKMFRLIDTGTFDHTQLKIHDLIKIDTFLMDSEEEEITLGPGRSRPPADADGHYWHDYSDSIGHAWRTTQFSEAGGLTLLFSAPDSFGDWQTTRLHCALRMYYGSARLPVEYGYHIIPLDTWQTVSRCIALAKKP